MEHNDLPHLPDVIDRMMTSELFQEQANLYMDEEDDSEPDDVIILHMDIREPLRTLQKLVEQKIGVNLKSYKFWLQDAQELEPHKNLVDQCVKGEGLVQINVQIQTTNQRINIVDVLKPTEAALALAAEEALRNSLTSNTDKSSSQFEEESQDSSHTSTSTEQKTVMPKPTANDKPCLNWVLDRKFKKEQAQLKIPDDPNDWTVPQVKHWFQWAVRQFELTGVSVADWAITGKALCALTHEEFRKKLPVDPGNVFWTHLQLLKECKFVSVVHKAVEQDLVVETTSETTTPTVPSTKEMRIMRKSTFHSGKNYSPVPSAIDSPAISVNSTPTFTSTPTTYGVGSGNNGQVQLWQFLLEILTDREHANIIQWVGTDGEFKLTDPERVARLWGEKKNKPAMNYEKLSRALRYYYDGDMISKVSGKRFAYKFDCDLKLLIGYDAAELSQLVNERSYLDESLYLEHMNLKPDDD